MAGLFRYLDCLDTVRHQLADQERIRNAGETMFRILSGETVRLSQTQAFDSDQILAFAAKPGFRDLVRNGVIEIVMRNGTEDPLTAFANAVHNDDLYLSSWTDIENPLQLDVEGRQRSFAVTRADAKAIISEAIREGHLPSGMPNSLYDNWKALIELNYAYRDYAQRSGSPQKARDAQFTLRKLLEGARDHARPYPYLQEPLRTMLEKVNGDNRSDYHRYIRHSLNERPEVTESLHSMVNMSYNRVIGSSLASHTDLTTTFEDAKEIVGAVETRNPTTGQINIEQDKRKFEGLTWDTLLEMRRIQDDPSLTRDEKIKRFKERSVVAAEELVTTEKKSVSFLVWPAVAAVGVNGTLGYAVGIAFDYFAPGSGQAVAEFAGAILAESLFKTSERTKNMMEKRAIEKRTEELIALQTKALDIDKGTPA